MRRLMLGCGSERSIRVRLSVDPPMEEIKVVGLDMSPDCNPDVLFDFESGPLPFEDNSFDRVYAFEFLEHVGSQGDVREFFRGFYEIWRVLKPNGYLVGTCPAEGSLGLWGDPSHKRVINELSFTFLSQQAYRDQVGKTPMSDFRSMWKGDFEPEIMQKSEQTLAFALRAKKP